MIKITFVVPYPELEGSVEETLLEYPDRDKICVSNQYFEYQATKAMKLDCEVVIARGLAAYTLKRSQKSVPVIDISVTGYDVIRAVAECKYKFNSKRIAIIGTNNMVYGAESIDKILNIDIDCYNIDREDEAENAVNRAIENGADAIIGGIVAYNFASLKGIDSVFIKTGKEAIRFAFDEAYRAAVIARQEREKAERFKIIMEYAHEGIVAVDGQGFITAFNKSAQKIMKVNPREVIGRNVEEVLPNTKLPRVIETGEEEIGELQQVYDTLIATNRVPIKIEDKVVGAIATFQDVTKIQELENQIRRKTHPKGLSAKYTFDDIIGSSQAIRDTREMAQKFSRVDSNVLLIGETGTGKELFAQSIHNLSSRREGPFVAVNCAALPENLLESELFGYVEGAFTGATKGGKLGLFELAHKGTIFLDEISELHPRLQGRLLRVLQEKEIMRLGHDRVIPIDVRVISASNKNLKSLVSQGQFRQDLLYRIDILNISIPPLRKRGEDTLVIFEHFLKLNNERFGKNIKTIEAKAKKLLLEHDWQGNIREVRNVCERLTVLSTSQEISENDVKKVIGYDEDTRAVRPLISKNASLSVIESSMERERELILDAIERSGNNKAEAARLLGIDRTTLWRKMKKWEV